MRSILSRSPTAACSVPSRSIADGARRLLAGGDVSCRGRAGRPRPCRRAWRCGRRGRRDCRCARRARRRRPGSASGRQGDVEVGEAVVDRGHGAGVGGRRSGADRTPLALHCERCERRPPEAVWPRWCWRGWPASRSQLQRALAAGRSAFYVALAAAGVVGAGRWRRLAPARRRLRRSLACAGALLAGFGADRRAGVAAPRRRARRRRSKAATSSSPASSPACRRPARTACAFASTLDAESRCNGRPAQLPPRIALGWYGGFHEDAALAQPQRELRAGQRWRFTRAAAPAARQPQPARLRLRAVAVRAGRARHRLRARRAAAAAARRGGGHPGRAAAPAGARRDLRRASPTGAPPACWPRSRSATRARSSARTGSCSATPASRT